VTDSRTQTFSYLILFLSVLLLLQAEGTPNDGTGIPHLEAEDAQAAVRAAVGTFNGFRSKDGQKSLLDLKLQTNTIAGLFHNLIGDEIARRAPYWSFKESGATGGDLIGRNGEHLELKTSSSLDVKGNQVSHNERYYLVSNFVLRPDKDELAVVWIRAGRLGPEDWRRPEGTQWAFLNEKGTAKLKTLWKDFGELPPSYLPGIGEVREKRLAGAGLYTVRQVAAAKLDALRQVLGMSEEQTRKVWEEAGKRVGE